MAEDTSRLTLEWEEIGLLCEGLSFASRPFHGVIGEITEEFDLGPRGAWVVMLLANGMASYPREMADFFKIGRSLITAELNRLTEAGLISATPSDEDRRQTRLELTEAGWKVRERMKRKLSELVLERFAGYSREEILLCSRMLHDFRYGRTDEEA